MDRKMLLQALLIKADTLYQSGKSAPEIAALAALWEKPTADISDGLLREAMDHHFKHAEYFPKPAHIVESANQIAASRPPCEQIALPETHPADRDPTLALILRRGSQIRKASELSGRPISFREAHERARREVAQGATA